MTESSPGPAPDRIERETTIDAPIEAVWSLVSTPGWWINDGTIVEHPIRYGREPDVALVSDPQHGDFSVLVVELDRLKYAAFRWSSSGSHSSLDSSTLVEFWLSGSDPVTVKVVESGFDALPGSADERRKGFDDNTAGWQIELAAAVSHLTGSG